MKTTISEIETVYMAVSRATRSNPQLHVSIGLHKCYDGFLRECIIFHYDDEQEYAIVYETNTTIEIDIVDNDASYKNRCVPTWIDAIHAAVSFPIRSITTRLKSVACNHS